MVKKYYFLILILIFSASLLSINLNKPFIGHHDWNGAWYSNFARNFTKYGLLQTKFGSVMNYDSVNKTDFKYSTHYPPLLPIFIYFSFKIFGIHEWSARVVPLVFSLGTIITIYLIGLRFFNFQTAVLASAISSVLPIMIYFGKMPVHEIIILPFVLLSIILYFGFVKQSNRNNFIKLVIILFLAHLVHWSAYFLTPIFFTHYLIFGKNTKKILVAIFWPIFSLFMFILHLFHTFLLTGSPLGGGLLNIFLDRMNITDSPLEYSTVNFLTLEARRVVIYYTRPIILFAAIFFSWSIFKIKKHQITEKIQLILVLGLFGLAYNVIFINAAFIHDYTIIYLLPFLVVAASSGFFLTVSNLKLHNQKIVSLAAILLLIVVATERFGFTRALQNSNSFLEGVSLGKIINGKTKSGDKILVLSPDFKQYFEVYTATYADRSINYELIEPERLQAISNRYSLVVAIPSRDTPPFLMDVLQQHYKATRIGQFVLFDVSLSNYSSL